MTKRRQRHMSYKTVSININTPLSQTISWLHDRLFLLGTKFSFLSLKLGNDGYIFISNILKTPSGFILSAKLNGRENDRESLGDVEIIVSRLDNETTSISYQYLPKLSDFACSLILDAAIHFNVFDKLPEDISNKLSEPKVPDEKISPTLELELFLENVTIDQFSDWLMAESKDILMTLFRPLGWLLEIQPPKVHFQTNYERKIIMEGRLYEHATRGTALFIPNPPINQECVYFECRQLSTVRLRILYKVNKLAIEYFRSLLNKIERNWPDSREQIQLFLIEHRGENVDSIRISMGPTIEIATGRIIPEPERFRRLEFEFKGTPAQFSVFVTSYAHILSDKHHKEILDIMGVKPVDVNAVQVKAVFFPIDFLEPEQEKGVYGDIIVQRQHNQNSLLKVEVKSENWNKVETTWNAIFSELKRQGWITEEIQFSKDKNASSHNFEIKLEGNIDIGENVIDSTVILGNHNTIHITTDQSSKKRKPGKPSAESY